MRGGSLASRFSFGPAAWLAGVVVLVALPWGKLVSTDETLFLRDVHLYFQPMKRLLAETVRAGEWPWWNPWILGGVPFYANPQVGLFYPPSVVLHVLPFPLAFNLFVLLHLLLLAAGAFLWLLDTGRSRPAAALGALALALGGFAASTTNLVNDLQALAWTGWILLAWARWRRTGTLRWGAATAIGFAVQFLAGEPFVLLATAAIALGLAWGEPEGPPARRSARAIGGLAAMALAAMALAAVQLVPTAELFWLSVRKTGLAAAEALEWSLHPAQAVHLVVPRYFGAAGGFEPRATLAPAVPWVLTGYLGASTAVLAAAGLGGPGRRRAAGWGVLGGLGVVMALGGHLPSYRVLLEVPLLGSAFRYPERWLLLPALAAPVLAADGVDRLGEPGGRTRALVAAGVLAAVGLAGLGIEASDVAGFARRWGPDHHAVVGAERVASLYRRGFLHLALAAAAAGTLVLAAWRRPEWRTGLVAGLPVLVALDLGLANPAAAPLGPEALYREAAVLDVLPADPLGFAGRWRVSEPGTDEPWALEGASIPDLHRWYAQILAPNLGALHGVLSQDGLEALRPRRVETVRTLVGALPPERRTRLLGLLATRRLFHPGEAPPGTEPVGEVAGGRVHRVIDPVPRAYLVRRAIAGPDTIGAMNRLLSGELDPRAVAFVHEGAGLDGPAERVEGGVRWREAGNHVLRLDVDAPGPALLVVADLAYPGWRAAVDGRPADLVPVNWLFHGVKVPAGRHEVVLAYRPRGIVPAAAVSLLALVVLAGALARGGRERSGGA